MLDELAVRSKIQKALMYTVGIKHGSAENVAESIVLLSQAMVQIAHELAAMQLTDRIIHDPTNDPDLIPNRSDTIHGRVDRLEERVNELMATMQTRRRPDASSPPQSPPRRTSRARRAPSPAL